MKVLTLDSRRRVCLGKIGNPDHVRYLANTWADGTIVLSPVDVPPAIVRFNPPAEPAS